MTKEVYRWKDVQYEFEGWKCIWFRENWKLRDVNTVPKWTRLTKEVKENLDKFWFKEVLPTNEKDE